MNDHYGCNFIGEKINVKVDLFYKMLNYQKYVQTKTFLHTNIFLFKTSKPIGGSFKERRSSKRESKKKKKQDKVSEILLPSVYHSHDTTGHLLDKTLSVIILLLSMLSQFVLCFTLLKKETLLTNHTYFFSLALSLFI